MLKAVVLAVVLGVACAANDAMIFDAVGADNQASPLLDAPGMIE